MSRDRYLEDLIESSSLGTPIIRDLAARTPSEVVERIRKRTRQLDLEPDTEPSGTPDSPGATNNDGAHRRGTLPVQRPPHTPVSPSPSGLIQSRRALRDDVNDDEPRTIWNQEALDNLKQPSAAFRATWTVAVAVIGFLVLLVVFPAGPPAGTLATPPPSEATLASLIDLNDTAISIGSTEFAEQQVLGQIAIQALRAANADVTDQTNLGSTSAVREALESGQVDAYYEYTGIAWTAILGQDERVVDSTEQFLRVRAADDDNGVVWLALASANDAYTIAANQDAVSEHGVANISDYAELANDDPDAAALCVPTEFVTGGGDGLPSLQQHYGFGLPEDRVRTMEPDRVYGAVGEGRLCQFGVVSRDAGEIESQQLIALQDDLAFFPPNNLAMAMRDEVYRRNPNAYAALFNTISDRLTDEKLSELNTEVAGGKTPAEVAREFLKGEKII